MLTENVTGVTMTRHSNDDYVCPGISSSSPWTVTAVPLHGLYPLINSRGISKRVVNIEHLHPSAYEISIDNQYFAKACTQHSLPVFT
jgi:hypothetical protein